MNTNKEFKGPTIKVDVFSLDGRMVEKIVVPNRLIDTEINNDLLHRVIKWQLAKARSGNHKTKNVSEVSGSTRKIMRQKGSGRARHSTRRVNIFRGGAKVFGPVTRSHETSINRKEKIAALRMAITYSIKTNSLFIIDSFESAEPKTKFWMETCKPWHNATCLLIGAVEESKNIFLATRNIHTCNFLLSEGLNVYDLLKNYVVLITKKELYNIIERLGYE